MTEPHFLISTVSYCPYVTVLLTINPIVPFTQLTVLLALSFVQVLRCAALIFVLRCVALIIVFADYIVFLVVPAAGLAFDRLTGLPCTEFKPYTKFKLVDFAGYESYSCITQYFGGHNFVLFHATPIANSTYSNPTYSLSSLFSSVFPSCSSSPNMPSPTSSCKNMQLLVS